MTDLNARTGCLQSSSSIFSSRVSMDDKVCTHGRRLIRELGALNLTILNGCTQRFGPLSGELTSFQPNGNTVIDYAIACEAMWERTLAFGVGDRGEWSDHAPILVRVQWPRSILMTGQIPSTQRRSRTILKVSLPTYSELDRRYIEVVQSVAKSKSDPMVHIYGFLPNQNTASAAPSEIYVWGSCSGVGSMDVRGGAGVYVGMGSRHNMALRVPGPALSERRTQLFAIWAAIKHFPTNCPLIVITTSKFAAEALTHFAERNAKTNWVCANGDLMKCVVDCIRHRTASLHIAWRDKDSTRGQVASPLQYAEALAEEGTKNRITHCPLLPEHLPTFLEESSEQSSGRCKITTDTPSPIAREGQADHHPHISPLGQQDVKCLDNHRGCSAVLRRQDRNMADFREAAMCVNSRRFWEIFCKLAGPSLQDSDEVTVASLLEVFEPRMNPLNPLPESFDATQYHVNEHIVDLIPEHTVDTTTEKFFDRLFEVSEIDTAKEQLGDLHPGRSAAGLDEVHYAQIRKMDSTLVTTLINDCLRTKDNPAIWIISLLVGVLKKGKAVNDPEGYRAVALESCMLKFVTLLFLTRFQEWTNSHHLIPPSQNGFRKEYRTNNNAFILRAAIQKARSNRCTLWVACVDISNAFPSVHRVTLWLKLWRKGAGGKIFDWLRMIYQKMRYKVRHGESMSESDFKSMIGILAGDTMSPMLWILYFADFDIPKTADDVELFGLLISHMEQADDLLLLALSPEGLQRKMKLFYSWCQKNFMIINAIKSVVGYHGDIPEVMPVFYFVDSVVAVVEKYTYVGMTFACGSFRADCFHAVLRPHYVAKAEKATTVAHCILHLESMIGQLPVNEGRILYMGCVNPHLIYGAEVALDSTMTVGGQLEKVQESFFRRLLGLSSKAVTVTLFTETGIWPIRFRRMELAIRFYLYALQRPHGTYLHAALRESIKLDSEGHHSWFSAFLKVLRTSEVRATAVHGRYES